MYTQRCIISLPGYHQFNLKLRLEAFAANTILQNVYQSVWSIA